MDNPDIFWSHFQSARMFFGRVDILNEIAAFVRSNQSVSIVGPPKIGKTSLLLRLMQAETRAAFGIEGEIRFVYIDCQELSSCRKDEIFSYLYAQITSTLQDLKPEPTLQNAISSPAWPAVEAVIRKVNHHGHRVVLMLDDLEHLAQNPNLEVSFYNALRSAAGRLRLVFLTTSSRPLFELTCFDCSKQILSSPFFNIFAQVFLGLLSKADARTLIRSSSGTVGGVFSPQLEDFLYQLVGGHPFALQVACFHAWESPDDFDKIELQTLEELEPHFQSCWHNLSKAEQAVLRIPAGAELQAAGEASLRVVLRDLVRKCLLVQVDGEYRYPSKAWEAFVNSRSP